MVRTIKAYIEAAKQRRENGEAGFSLVELIVVVVILGILAAVAIPIFTGIQAEAEKNAAEAAAANAASQIAAAMAQDEAAADALAAAQSTDYTIAWETAAPTNLDGICVTATKTGGDPSVGKGPGC